MSQQLPANVTLVAADKSKVYTTRPVAKMSRLINDMIGDSDDDDDEVEQEIPLPNIPNKFILDRVMEFCSKHVEDPLQEIEKPLKSNKLSEVTNAWDAEFMNLDQDSIFDMILAANYLDIPSLLDLACAGVACKMKGKNTEQIRQEFNIINDFTPEEEEEVIAETKWCDETAANLR